MILAPVTPTLVSIIVRSMGRAELATALASAAAQDHPAIEIVIVDATGGEHPPLPEIPLRAGHSIRMVGTGHRLIRPLAANVGLDASCGDYFCFLDDDDTYDPLHVSTLLAEAILHPECLVIYGQTRMQDPAVATVTNFGHPFNRALMYFGPLFYPQAALFRRDVLGTTCRFDPAFEICEDRDFLAQIAQHSDFHYLPTPVFNYRPDLGTSGTGGKTNRNVLRATEFDTRFRAKWAGPGIVHIERAARGNRRAIAAFHRGDVVDAARRFDEVLVAYPGDPNALHGRARVALVTGNLVPGLADVECALGFNPDALEYRLTRAEILAGLGKVDQAIADARAAAGDPALRAAAHALERSLAARSTVAPPGETSRNAPCPCGSGRRYKHCHGATGTAPPSFASMLPSPDPGIRAALADAARGEAQRAHERLQRIDAELLESARDARWAGDLCDELGDDARALVFLGRANAISPDPATRHRIEKIFQRRFRSLSDRSLVAAAAELRPHTRARPPGSAALRPVVHVVATLPNTGGAELRALRLYDTLHPYADVRLWSAGGAPRDRYKEAYPIEELRPDLGRHPSGGTVVFCGHYFDWGEWTVSAPIDRIVICHNDDHPDALIRKLVGLAERRDPVPVDFSFPSRMHRDRSGLSGAVEICPIDLARFSASSRHATQRPLTVGRHARDHPLKHHPNDPSLYRRIAAAGHRVRILGGLLLAPAFKGESPGTQVELIAEEAIDAREFLDSLDCFIYRTHPHYVEAGGSVILEAMAMELPVIAFRGPIGNTDLIVNGENGFVVDSENEALARIEQLAADPALRLAIGKAARESLVNALEIQRTALLSFYLSGIDGEHASSNCAEGFTSA